MPEIPKIRIRPYSLAELAKFYKVCARTLKRWMNPFKQEIGERQGRYYTVAQVKIILEKIGLPEDMAVDE